MQNDISKKQTKFDYYTNKFEKSLVKHPTFKYFALNRVCAQFFLNLAWHFFKVRKISLEVILGIGGSWLVLL